MKRIFFIALIFLNVNTFAQKYPIYQNLGSPNTAIENNGGMIIKGTLVPPRFTDTAAANAAPHTKFYPGNQINTTSDNLYWYRSSDTTKWIKMGAGSGGSGIDSAAYHTTTQINDTTIKQTKPNGDGTVWQFISSGTGSGQVNSDWNATSGVAQILNKPIINNAVTNGVVEGFTVTWSGTGFLYDITAGSIKYNNVTTYYPSSQVTLNASDPTNPRIDDFYVDTLGNTGKITGTPAVNPIQPQTSYGQFLLSFANVGANDTIPTNVNLTTIYDENTEWTTSSSGTGVIDFNNTSNPYHLTKAIKVTSQSAGFAMIFTNPSGIDTAGIGDVLKFFIYTATNLSNGYTFQFYSGSNAVSTPLVITQPGYGYNPYLTGTYQNVSIPLSAFTFYSPYYNAIKITANGSNANPVYWDYVQIQRGVYQFAPTDYSNKVDSVTSINDSLFYWVKGLKKFVNKSSSGSTYTASNGLTMNSNNIQLGGNATKQTVINTDSSLNIIGIGAPSSPFYGTKTASSYSNTLFASNNKGTGIYGSTNSGIGVYARSLGSGNAIYAVSNGGTTISATNNSVGSGVYSLAQNGGTAFLGVATNGIYINSVGGIPIQSLISNSDSLSVLPQIVLNRSVFGILRNKIGSGQSIRFTISDNKIGHGTITSSEIQSYLTNDDSLHMATSFAFKTLYNNSTRTTMVINDTGSIKFNAYGSGSFPGTPTKSLSVDATGNVIETSASFTGTSTLASGTVTVSTANVKTGAKIFLTYNTPSGTQGFLSAPVGSIVNNTSFVINSSSSTDNSTVNWQIINP